MANSPSDLNCVVKLAINLTLRSTSATNLSIEPLKNELELSRRFASLIMLMSEEGSLT